MKFVAITETTTDVSLAFHQYGSHDIMPSLSNFNCNHGLKTRITDYAMHNIYVSC